MEKTKSKSGITKEFFGNYFYGRDYAYAYKLGKVNVYSKPKELIDFGLKRDPQSFVYILVVIINQNLIKNDLSFDYRKFPPLNDISNKDSFNKQKKSVELESTF